MTYRAPSGVRRARKRTDVSFTANTRREGVYFKGRLRDPIAFREAIGALHDVVITDLKYRPEQAWQVERYKDWRRETFSAYGAEFWRRNREYFEYLYKSQFEQWVPLDPVVTVHPDQVFFECFSRDESLYGRLAAKQAMFEGVEDLQVGTTNVDFSTSLYREMEVLRSYRNTDFTIDPAGLQVQTQGREEHTEKRIDLPESWLRGFLSVQSAMLLPQAVSLDLAPVDIFNLCVFLRRHRELLGPRALRFELTPGERIAMVMEPWEHTFLGETVYHGSEKRVVRTWGRRRIHVLERLLPIAKGFRLTLLGRGLPTFYHTDLGEMVFSLGMSGWTSNDWTGSTNFSLLLGQKGGKEREEAGEKALEYLKSHHRAPLGDIATAIGAERDTALDALRLQCEAGKVMFDFDDDVFRYRPVLKEDVPLDTLRYRDPREKEAYDLVQGDAVTLKGANRNERRKRIAVNGDVKDGKKTHHPELIFDLDGRVITATCDCWFYRQNKLYQGPCPHIAALKIAHERKESLEALTG